jgi:hypothetical protein
MRRVIILTSLALLPLGASFPAEPEKPAPPEPNVAARIGDKVITLDEVDQKAMAANMNAYQALYTARRQALEELIAEELLEKTAAARGISRDELVESEIDPKVKPVTDADIEAFYNQNRNRMGNRTLDQIRGQILTFLQNQYRFEARKDFLDQVKKDAGVRISLQPPRAEVRIAAHDPTKGSDKAKITIVEFSDFQ